MNEKKEIIIAEIGSVHDGSFGNAKKLIELAAKCGADCVKFQTHIAEAESLPSAPNPVYFNDETRIEYFNRTSFSVDQWKKLKNKAEKEGVEFLSSPFSLEAVDLLEEVGISAYKIPSGEVTNIPLLDKISELKKPVFLSSGMSNWAELDKAVEIFKNCDLTLMQCSSQYPCPPEEVGLNILSEMKERYNVQVGFSDHTLGFAASISSVAYGARVIEKHITFSKEMYGSDALHSMEPSEFYHFCKEVKHAFIMHNKSIDKDDISKYLEMKKTFQKSIVAACDISADQKIKIEHLSFKKPGDGISASDYKNLLGLKALRDIKKDQKLSYEDLFK